MARLTKLEKEMLFRAAEFVLAGEWPWEDCDESTYEQERAALATASSKLQES